MCAERQRRRSFGACSSSIDRSSIAWLLVHTLLHTMEVDAGTSIDSLPDELLGRVLALLKDTERCVALLHAIIFGCSRPHQPQFTEAPCSSSPPRRRLTHRHRSANCSSRRLCTAALVCKRWHAAVHTPAFVEAVACSSQFSMRRRSRGKARFASLARWLRRHGGGARRLALAMAIEAPPDSVWRDPLRGLLEACASAGALEELVCAMRAADRYRDPVLLFAVGREWAALTSLRRLDIHGAGSLQADLSPLTRLERLQLRTECEEPVSPGARLPPALTALLLGLAFDQDRRDPYYHPFVLPRQVRRHRTAGAACVLLSWGRQRSLAAAARLPACSPPSRQVASVSGSLRSLELAGHSGPVENSSFAVVSCLTGLEELTVRRFSNLPWQLLAALPSLALLRLRLLRLREGARVFRQHWPACMHPSLATYPQTHLCLLPSPLHQQAST